MKSLNELKSLRERLEKGQQLAEKPLRTIIIGMGTCGIAAGARGVLLAIMDELAAKNLSDTAVTQTSCIGMCEKEPLVEVVVEGKSTLYAYVNGEKARRIVLSHIINGEPVTEWSVERALGGRV
ncbi:MAG: (2Fe-2S) ferredoxin domain-containing protein [Peptococcaceae bacterium]|nr:(2Fe-2S) ferredoxin domain-containing protein [Peptococcaceae bacterium]